MRDYATVLVYVIVQLRGNRHDTTGVLDCQPGGGGSCSKEVANLEVKV